MAKKQSLAGRARTAAKTVVKDVKYARNLYHDNPGWREGGSGKLGLGSLHQDVRTHRALQDSLSSKSGNWAGSSAASIKRLREANNTKKCGGTIRRKKSK